MLSGLESGIGLDIVIGLQAFGNPLFDALARFMHAAGNNLLFYMGLVLLVYWAFNRQAGLHVAIMILSASVLTGVLKELFQRPRPHLLHPELVTALVSQDGYGLPSGHVLIALAAWATLAWCFRRRWLTALAALIVLVMAWARMYAGVHYPQDVIGGAVFGGLLLWAYTRGQAALGRWWKGLALPGQAGLIGALAILTALLTGLSATSLTYAGLMLGVGGGAVWERRAIGFELRPEPARRALNFALGISLTLAAYLALRAAFESLEPAGVFLMVRYGLVGIVATVVWPWIAVRAGLAIQQADNDN